MQTNEKKLKLASIELALLHKEKGKLISELTSNNNLLSLTEKIGNVGNWQWNITENEFIFSKQCKLNYGVTTTKLSMEDFFSIAHPDDSQAIKKAFQDVSDEVESAYDVVHRIIRQDNGEIRHMHSYGEVIERGNSGKAHQMIGFVKDITEKKQLEQKINDVSEERDKRAAELAIAKKTVARLAVANEENEKRFEISHKFSNTGTWEYNLKSGDLYWSRMIQKMFGGPEGNLTTSYENFVSALHPEDREFVLDAINSCTENGKEYDVSYRVVWPDGTIRWLAAWGYCSRNIHDEAERMLGVVQDITERKQAEDKLLTKSQITAHMEEGANLVRVSDQAIVYTNSAFDEMFGYEQGELYGKHVSIINAPSVLSPEDVARDIISKLEVKRVWRGEIYNIKKDGTPFWCSATISDFDHPVYGKVWVSVHSDISEQKLMHEKLSYQAGHDSLTGLINRYEFEKRVTRMLSDLSRENTEHAMCFLDLDQFKIINDTCGHAAGDELLRQLGGLLSKTLRKCDTLARLGGDEFGVLMEHCTLEQAHRAATGILGAIMSYQFIWDGKTFRIGASIGLAAMNQASVNFTHLFQQADAACYLAKDLGRNRIYTYHPDDTELAVRHGEIQWVGRINQALDEDRFCLYAQPIVSLDSESQRHSHRHYEILVRMLDVEDGVIPPGAFLPAAERYNLIEKLDTWVVSRTCEFLAEQSAFTNKIDFVSINLSGQSLTNEKFLESILQIFKKTGISPKKVCFEVTETAAVSDMNSAINFINSLKKIGCQFALDDFGSGISSFGYLKNLPVDYLKIDGIFVKDIVDDPIDFAMVKSINEIGQLMGMKTIAEFVENDAIKHKLKTIGVNYGQGYGLGRPEPLAGLIL